MPAPIIEIRGLGKLYQINATRESYLSLREEAMKWLTPSGRKKQAAREEFWALKDVDLDVQEGEAVGIIGRNGAGKSTLLKILSRITPPTEGEVAMRGRVASLIEVGTGFHPELTGRENVYLNGAILGMSRAEIKRKFDEIVSFADVEKFLETPVKRYSSGMYVRLAFAVAAHLEPEILVIDEVLAVGDAQFQKKCLGRMREVARGGRTVLFVSHNMGAISQLCPTCVWLDQGRIKSMGATEGVVTAYLKDSDASGGTGVAVFKEDSKKEAQLRRVRLMDQAGDVTQKFDCDQPIVIDLVFQVHKKLPGLYGYLELSRMDGTTVMVSDSLDSRSNPLDNLDAGSYSVRILIPPRILGSGEYNVYLSFASRSAEKFAVDSPGIVCSFTLDDFTSDRGNVRTGFLSTLLPWGVTRI